MKDLFKVEDCDCLRCENAIFKKYNHINTYECKFHIIQDLEFCFKFRDSYLKQLRVNLKKKKRFKIK